MFEKVCVTCKESFGSLYRWAPLCSLCNLESDLSEMAIWGTD